VLIVAKGTILTMCGMDAMNVKLDSSIAMDYQLYVSLIISILMEIANQCVSCSFVKHVRHLSKKYVKNAKMVIN
jgi:hypothetical protein